MSSPPPDPFPRMVALIVVVMLIVSGVLVWALIDDGAFRGRTYAPTQPTPHTVLSD